MNSVQSSGHTTSLSKKKDSQFEVSEQAMNGSKTGAGIYYRSQIKLGFTSNSAHNGINRSETAFSLFVLININRGKILLALWVSRGVPARISIKR